MPCDGTLNCVTSVVDEPLSSLPPGALGQPFTEGFNPFTLGLGGEPVSNAPAGIPLTALGFDPTQAFLAAASLDAPAAAPELAPVVVAASPVLPFLGFAGLGIGASLYLGAPPPVEGLTGSGFEPEPQPAGAPPRPPTSPTVAASPEMPFNWMDIARGFIPDPSAGFGQRLLDWLAGFQPPGTAQIGHQIWDLLNPGSQASDPGSLFSPSTPSLPLIGPSGEPGPAEPGPLPELAPITITAPRPTGAPIVVADPVLSPIGLPQPGPGASPNPAAAPVPAFIPSPGAQPSPVEQPQPLPSIVGAPSPAPVLQPAPAAIPTPALEPGISPATPVLPSTPVIVGPSIAVGGPGPAIPGLIAGVGPNPLLDLATDPQAAMATASTHCVTTKAPPKKDKKKKKHQRDVCHSGTYRELKSGLTKHPLRTIPCR